MRVFHFRDEKYGIKSIKDRRLKISRIMELNDPFEFPGADLSNPEFRKAINKTKKQISNNTGILCHSKDWHNPVQWSHYADNHKGVCLGFEISKRWLAKVEYADERLSISGTIDMTNEKNFNNKIFSLVI
ncbi:MAG: DUF2971 domain-containing protein [Porticoccaceae bacterium]